MDGCYLHFLLPTQFLKFLPVSWFESTDNYENGVAEENAEEFMKTIDCFVMGSRTYEHALELSKNFGWAYGEIGRADV